MLIKRLYLVPLEMDVFSLRAWCVDIAGVPVTLSRARVERKQLAHEVKLITDSEDKAQWLIEVNDLGDHPKVEVFTSTRIKAQGGE